MSTEPLLYAILTFVIAMICGLLPVYSKVKQDANRLKMFTAIASGIIIASAMLVVIPEGYALAVADEHAEETELIAGTALILLDVEKGTLNASQGIESIEELIAHDDHAEEDEEDEHAHDEHDHDEHGHDEESHSKGLAGEIEHVIEEVEEGEITADAGIDEIEELVSAHGAEEHEDHSSELLIGVALIGGFILMLVLEGSGIGHAVHEEHHDHNEDHGHDHVHHGSGWMLVFGLTLHAATDGIAVGAALATGSISLTAAVVFAVVIHKGPAAFSLGVFSMHERQERKETIRDVLIFSLATPIMIVLAFFALSGLETSVIGLAMLFSAGTFLYVATVDTLPDIHNPETGKKSMLYVVLGVVLMLLLLLGANMLDIGHAH